MKPKTELLHSYWDKSGLPQKEVMLDQLKLEETIASVFSNGPCYFYVVDFFDRQIEYMSPLINKIHQLDYRTATFQDILEQIHPDDMEFVNKAEATLADTLFLEFANDKFSKSKVPYCFRMKTLDGSYQLFNHQALILNYDENGGISKALNIHTNISHLTTQNNNKVCAIGYGEPSYLNISIAESNILPTGKPYLFTKREIQVIRLMSEGLTNVDISERLTIALNTVKNHRKNILRKAECKNTGQLITKCITDGLI